MRVTRVDTIGRPVPGPCSTVVTSGFVNVEMTAEIEEGEETTVRTAGGDLCVSERGCDQLKWINVSVEFCQVDPDLFSMINPTWTKLFDCNGETIGWEESHTYSCDAGFALEVWSDVTGYTPKDPNAQGAWVYYLLPFLVGGTLGDMTIENGAVTFTITGRTKKGSQWLNGPYNVMCNPPDGACGPLITPFNPEAPRRIFLTTCRPPEAVCGCQPLSSPDGPVTDVFEDVTDTSRMSVLAAVAGTGPFTVDWGDGTKEDLPSGLVGKTHRYGRSGSYTVGIYPTATPNLATFSVVTVPFVGTVPGASLRGFVFEDTADTTRMTAKADWTNDGSGTVSIDWGDGTAKQTAQAETGSTTHLYAQSGVYTVTIADESDATRKVTRTVTIPFGLYVTALVDAADPDRRTVSVTANNATRGSVNINWGDNTALGSNVGDGTSTSKHKYSTGGTYTITVTDADDSQRTATKQVTVPFGPVTTITQAMSDASKMSINLTADNGANGSVTIDWGDGTADGTNAGDGVAITLHKYANDGIYTVTVTDATNPAITTTRQATVPYDGGLALTATIAESDPPGVPRREVTLTWDNKDQGPVTINWDDGTAVENGAVSGTADHTYAADGTYDVVVTDVNNVSRTITVPVTVPFTA
jgi:hypothetical protein